MKNKALLFASVLLISLNACGQTAKDVPAGIKTTFSQKFPAASKVEWGRENDQEWEAEFKLDGKEYSATFDNAGVWMETECEISLKEVPASVKTTLDKESAGFKIGESVTAEDKTGKVYEFLLSKDKKEYELLIDLNGKLIKKEEVKEEAEKDEKN
jgi:hypothetical protein